MTDSKKLIKYGAIIIGGYFLLKVVAPGIINSFQNASGLYGMQLHQNTVGRQYIKVF